MGMIWEEVGNLMALGLRMKNLHIMEVHWKIWFLRWVHEKPIYIGELGGGGAWQKRGGGVFEVGGWYPNANYESAMAACCNA